ncbi:hypothetical protein [Aeromicrobium sp. UC242_57]|uniref:hypothetical protein n=1 Tax=Aeromicrobium sp. UC242_57 TaxID=3374624 RepID=UPI0037937FEE
MIIVAGWLLLEPSDRPAYLAGCREVVEQARAAPGLSRLQPHRRRPGGWADQRVRAVGQRGGLTAFRGEGPDEEQQAEVLDASVRRYQIASEGPA